MPISEFKIRRGTTGRILSVALNDTSIILTGSSVFFRMKAYDGSLKIDDKPANIIIATVTPQIAYAFDPVDVDTNGDFWGIFLIRYADSTEEYQPDPSNIIVKIRDNFK